MKVLFVCRYNVGRSQMAKAFYNFYTKSNDADSAGIKVKEAGQTLIDRKNTKRSEHFFVLDVMKDAGIDITNATREPLKEPMLATHDKIISMVDKADTPKWLIDSPKYVYWDVKDPRGQNFEVTAKARDLIKSKVLELLKYQQA